MLAWRFCFVKSLICSILVTKEVINAPKSIGVPPEQRPPPRLLIKGHFSIGFHNAPLRPDQWQLGTDPSRVDILLVHSKTKDSKSVAGVHLILLMNPSSGVWNIVAKARMTVENHQLDADHRYCLKHQDTIIDINGFIYNLHFVITNEEQAAIYRACRNNHLTSWHSRFRPPEDFTGIPFGSDCRLRSACFNLVVGGGSSGVVFRGFDPSNGYPRAIKRLGKYSPVTLIQGNEQYPVHFSTEWALLLKTVSSHYYADCFRSGQGRRKF